MIERRTATGIALKWSQFIIAAIVYLLTLGMSVGTMITKTGENEKQIENKVDRREFDITRDEIIRRLDRIEKKLDREKDMRELDEAYDKKAKR